MNADERELYMKTLVWIAVAIVAAIPGRADNWQLVWSDEFNGPANTLPDAAKWTFDIGHGKNGWGNQELENYTRDPANVSQDGKGNLVIQALRMPDGSYTSGRIKTQGKFNIQYGRIEARIKIPYGQGIWPAFWMLGNDIGSVGWPAGGEIDIMENIGKEPAMIHGSMHGPGYSGNTPLTSTYKLPSGALFADDFHVYRVTWSAEAVVFAVDGNEYYRVTPQSLPAGTKWVYDHPFFLLLNVAVGGRWPGKPDETSTFPQSMLVDWVRVYQLKPPSSSSPKAP